MEIYVNDVEMTEIGGFRAVLDGDGGYFSEWSSSDDAGTVQMWKLQQFDATYYIWQRQAGTR